VVEVIVTGNGRLLMVVLVTLALITLEMVVEVTVALIEPEEMVVEVTLTGKTVVDPVITVEVAGVTDKEPETRREPSFANVNPWKVLVA
jgi:hypothetical protein